MDPENIKKVLNNMNDGDRVSILRDLLKENKKDLELLKDMIYSHCDDCDGVIAHMCYKCRNMLCSSCRINCGCGNSFCYKHMGIKCSSCVSGYICNECNTVCRNCNQPTCWNCFGGCRNISDFCSSCQDY